MFPCADMFRIVFLDILCFYSRLLDNIKIETNLRALKASKAPKATKDPAATKAPKATKDPSATKAPKATKDPSATKAPKATKDPAATKAPKDRALKAPKATKDPAATNAPVRILAMRPHLALALVSCQLAARSSSSVSSRILPRYLNSDILSKFSPLILKDISRANSCRFC